MISFVTDLPTPWPAADSIHNKMGLVVWERLCMRRGGSFKVYGLKITDRTGWNPMLTDNLLFLSAGGILISVEAFNIKKHYTSVDSKVTENQYSFLLPISIINIALIALSLFLGLYADFFYSIAILSGMSIGLLGDLNNKS